MDKRTIFERWAPPHGIWSPWAKATLFAQMADVSPPVQPGPAAVPPTIAIPPAAERCVLVIDLPGAAGIAFGLTLAVAGYRPVPLYNACSPRTEDRVEGVTLAIDTDAILAGLIGAADRMAGLSISPDAPPAFLVDARRASPNCAIEPEVFDNRSVVFASDFPSANFLRAQNASRALLVHDPTLPIGRDLLHALRSWQVDGISVTASALDGSALTLQWPRGGVLGEWLERAKALLTLRRHPGGGFGGFVPESSGG
jgi:hypothetical protein